MHKVSVIIDVVIAFSMIICIIYNMIMGIQNHDAYYLILGILDYIFLIFSIKNIEDYIDNTDNV